MAYPKLVGILNVTPDSFSDGGLHASRDAALTHALQLIDDGAKVIDVGAESTRPGATPISADEEMKRLEPLLADVIALAHSRDVLVSLDTRHAETARYGLLQGVDWVNDVNGLRDDAMIDALAGQACDVVVMHSVGVPVDSSRVIADDECPIAHVKDWFEKQLGYLEDKGITQERVILDPGIGFGKSANHSLALLSRVNEFRSLGCRVFIGHSRKSFMTLFTDQDAAGRDDVTLAISGMLVHQPIDYLRVHDVAQHRQLWDAL
ncbi:MAG: dihydropteroate synthase [Rickettsiales bacterium]|nr:dihydropteroate synthase [Rickettsiales bacterium]